VEDAAQRLGAYLKWMNLVAAAAIVTFGGFGSLPLSACFFTVVSILIFCAPSFRENPFSLVLWLNISVYIVAPLVFLSIVGSDFEYGRGISRVPATSEAYAASAPMAIVFLTVCLAAMCAGLAQGGKRGRPPNMKLERRIGLWPAGIFAAIVFVLAVRDNASILADLISGDDVHRESLLVFIFFDHAYLVLGPMIYFSRLAQPDRWTAKNTALQFMLMITAMWAVSVLAGSKGGILLIASLSFLIPLSYLRRIPNATMLVPTPKVALAIIPVILVIFAYTLAVRELRFVVNPDTSATATVMNAVTESASASLAFTVGEILYRISALLDRYILTFHNFATNGFDASYAAQVMGYLGKNFLNLVLPGTPFPEAYSPSSNLFVQTLFREPLISEVSRSELLASLNTQPYSIFGAAVLLVGGWAPVLLFVTCFVLARTYARTQSMLPRLALLYALPGLFHAYALEVVAATVIHFFVSLWMFGQFARLMGARERPGKGKAGTPAPVLHPTGTVSNRA